MWTLILQVALKLLDFGMDKYKENKELTEAYLKFVDMIQKHVPVSVKLHDSYDEQMKELESRKPPESLL